MTEFNTTSSSTAPSTSNSLLPKVGSFSSLRNIPEDATLNLSPVAAQSLPSGSAGFQSTTLDLLPTDLFSTLSPSAVPNKVSTGATSGLGAFYNFAPFQTGSLGSGSGTAAMGSGFTPFPGTAASVLADNMYIRMSYTHTHTHTHRHTHFPLCSRGVVTASLS